jgi:hypothetical protein
MDLVKEETMKPRTRTLGAVGATIVTAGLVLGLAFGGNSAASSTTPETPPTVSMPMSQMPDMDSTMPGAMDEMAAMMGSVDITAMHSMMHQMMEGVIDDETLAACDTAHEAMAGSMTSTPEQAEVPHGAHHGTTGS